MRPAAMLVWRVRRVRSEIRLRLRLRRALPMRDSPTVLDQEPFLRHLVSVLTAEHADRVILELQSCTGHLHLKVVGVHLFLVLPHCLLIGIRDLCS